MCVGGMLEEMFKIDEEFSNFKCVNLSEERSWKQMEREAEEIDVSQQLGSLVS